tara:strand:- start:3653 stop:3808 length:156 start_codon:yes stop_codon:yes gene_type:complete
VKLIITTEQHNHKPIYKGTLTTNNQTYVSRSVSRQAVISSLKEQAQQEQTK